MSWLEFVETYRIDHITQGKNVGFNEVNIKCPYCEDDPSYHMGLSLSDKPYFNCWRNSQHKGAKPNFLISKLLGVDYTTAKEIEKEFFTNTPDLLKESLVTPKSTLDIELLEYLPVPTEWIGLDDEAVSYIAARCKVGIKHPNFIKYLYKLYISKGRILPDRVIFPVFDHQKQFVAATGRNYRGLTDVRYKSLPSKLKLERINKSGIATLDPLNDHLLWEEELSSCDKKNYLVIVEGPFDALNIVCDVEQLGGSVVATFGKVVTTRQKVLISFFSKFYDKVIILFDYDAIDTAEELKAELDLLCYSEVVNLSGRISAKDAGEFRPEHIQQLKQLLEKS